MESVSKAKMFNRSISGVMSGVFLTALLILSACGGGKSTPCCRVPGAPGHHSDGYIKLSYTDAAGVAQTMGTPLMKEGSLYEEVNALQFPSVTPSDMFVEIDLPETAVAKKKTEFFPVLEYGTGITDLIYRDEDLQNTGDQIIFTAKIVYLDMFMPRGATQGEIQFQLADDSGAYKDELVSVRFRKK
jgi:hypothetical protein